jgi:hypothetical protein
VHSAGSFLDEKYTRLERRTHFYNCFLWAVHSVLDLKLTFFTDRAEFQMSACMNMHLNQ